MSFTSKQLEKYADVLIWAMITARRGGKFKKYDSVLIRYDNAALPLTEVIYKKLLEQKYIALPRAERPETLSKIFYTQADKRQLQNMAAGEKEFHESVNGMIALRAPMSLTNLKNTDPAKIAVAAVARKPFRDILDRREQNGQFSWTLANYPTPELAAKAGLSVPEYARQIVLACFLDEKDPVAKWKRVMKEMNEISHWLSALPIQTLHVASKHMDLEILLGEKRKFISGGGNNIPSFEIFTSPDWRGTKGVYYADLSSYRSGNYVKGVRLEFKAGRVIKSSAEQGGDFVKKMLGMDRGAAQIGEFSLTDRRFSKINKFMADTLYDENFGGKYGNCHLAVGASYIDTFAGDVKKMDKKLKTALGFNDSSLHWDLINTEDKVVKAALKNGKTVTIYEKGQFKY